MARETANPADALESLLPRAMAALFQVESDPFRDRPLGQIRVLRALYESDRSCTELRCRLGVSASSVTQMANRLVRHGLVEKYGVDGDGRTRMLRLSEDGRQLMDMRRAARIAEAEKVVSRLPPGHVEDLVSALEALVETAGIGHEAAVLAVEKVAV